jgi:hypothetical protein
MSPRPHRDRELIAGRRFHLLQREGAIRTAFQPILDLRTGSPQRPFKPSSRESLDRIVIELTEASCSARRPA